MIFYRPLTERGGVLPVYQVHLQQREYDLLLYPPQDFPHYTHFSDLYFQVLQGSFTGNKERLLIFSDGALQG